MNRDRSNYGMMNTVIIEDLQGAISQVQIINQARIFFINH